MESGSHQKIDISKVVKTLNAIERLAKNIVKTALPIMKGLIEDDNEYVEDVLYERDDLSEDEVAEELRKLLGEITNDSDVILTEIKEFKRDLKSGVIDTDKANFYPFLLEVWSGDSYGEPEVVGLELLVKDLETSFSMLDDDLIINAVLERL